MLKQLVRDHIDPGKDLGHSDRQGKKKEEHKNITNEGQAHKENEVTAAGDGVKKNPDGTVCEDCK